MPNFDAMNDVELHFGQPYRPSGEFGRTIVELKYPFESIMIRSNCKTAPLSLDGVKAAPI